MIKTHGSAGTVIKDKAINKLQIASTEYKIPGHIQEKNLRKETF
jgi:hypothetical protein